MELLSVKEIAKNQKEMEIKIDKAAFDVEVNKAYKKNVASMNVPGFRRGKAPKSIIEKLYGKGVFYEDAINALLPDAYDAAVTESKLDVVSRPDIDIKTIDDNGVIVTAKVYVKPEVVVTEYKGLKATREAVEITDEAVDAEIKKVIERNARIIDITDRPAKMGDEVVFDFDGYVDDKPFEGGKAEKHTLKLGSGQFIPGFEEQVAGKSIGEHFDVNVTFPADYHEKTLAGKQATFKCLIHEIKEEELPELNDDFVKDVSEFDTVDQYKADTKKKLEDEANKAADAKVDEALMDLLVKNMEGDIPECMFDNEVENELSDYENRLRYQGLKLEDFMKYTGQTLDSLKKSFRPQAEKQVKTRLALEYVVTKENIVPTDDEIQAEYKKIADAYGMDVEKVKESIKSDAIAKDVAVGKAVDFVRANADISGEKKAAKKTTKAAAKKETAEAEAPAEEKKAAKAPAKAKKTAETPAAEVTEETPAKKTTKKTSKKTTSEG